MEHISHVTMHIGLCTNFTVYLYECSFDKYNKMCLYTFVDEYIDTNTHVYTHTDIPQMHTHVHTNALTYTNALTCRSTHISHMHTNICMYTQTSTTSTHARTHAHTTHTKWV